MALMNGWLPVWLFSYGMMEIFSPNYPKGKTTCALESLLGRLSLKLVEHRIVTV